MQTWQTSSLSSLGPLAVKGRDLRAAAVHDSCCASQLHACTCAVSASQASARHHDASAGIYQGVFHVWVRSASAHARTGSNSLRAEDSAGRRRRHQINGRLWLRWCGADHVARMYQPPLFRHSIENLDTRLVALVAYMDVPCALCVNTTCVRASGSSFNKILRGITIWSDRCIPQVSDAGWINAHDDRYG